MLTEAKKFIVGLFYDLGKLKVEWFKIQAAVQIKLDNLKSKERNISL